MAEATNMEPTAMSDPVAVDDHLRDRRPPRGPRAREAEAPEVTAAAGADHLGPTRRGAREQGASGGGVAGMIPYPWRARAVAMALAILTGVASYLLSGRT